MICRIYYQSTLDRGSLFVFLRSSSDKVCVCGYFVGDHDDWCIEKAINIHQWGRWLEEDGNE